MLTCACRVTNIQPDVLQLAARAQSLVNALKLDDSLRGSYSVHIGSLEIRPALVMRQRLVMGRRFGIFVDLIEAVHTAALVEQVKTQAALLLARLQAINLQQKSTRL